MQTSVIEAAFQDFTQRKDIAILLINQHVRLVPCSPWALARPSDRAPCTDRPATQIADKIRSSVDRYQAPFPALLEIPSKEHPYGASCVCALCALCANRQTRGVLMQPTVAQTPKRTRCSSACRSCVGIRRGEARPSRLHGNSPVH